MSAPITIRNLTAQPLTLKRVERYEVPEIEATTASNPNFFVANLTSTFASLINNASAANKSPSAAQLGDKVQSYATEDVDLCIAAFSTYRTNIEATQRQPTDQLRLTFHGDDGGKWRIDTPTPSPVSQVLTPLNPDREHEYTAIYLPDSLFLALFESTNLHCWMRNLDDSTPLSALSIPGSHNSPTCYKALPSVRCQAVSPVEQLQNGVRFFDIRLQVNRPDDPTDEDLSLVHGAFPISLTGPKKFRHLLDSVHAFLRANPSETLIMSLKREGIGNATDQQLSLLLHDHYISSEPDRWWTQPRVPRLGEARGKIVLLRRFALADALRQGRAGWGLDAESWAYNTPHCLHGAVCVQDFCEVLEPASIDTKIRLCCEHFERAAAVTTSHIYSAPPGPLYLNFLSAANFWRVECWPDRIAAKVNPAVVKFLCESHNIGDRGRNALNQALTYDGGVGIVVCDWVGKAGDWDLVRCIVGMNSRLLLRKR